MAESLGHSAMEGIFVYFFLIILQPFGIKEWAHPYKYAIILLHGIVVFVSVFTVRELFPRLSKGFFEEKNWVIWKEILTSLVLLGIITAGIIVVNVFVIDADKVSFLTTYLSVLVIGFFPITFWIMSDYILKLKKYSDPAQIVNDNEVPKDEEITIKAENNKDSYSFLTSSIHFIIADDNYCTVHWSENSEIKSVLIRTSLIKIENQLGHRSLVRIHKSYLVNMNKVQKITGNAQGYKLHLQESTEPIPVGRTYNEVLRELKK